MATLNLINNDNFCLTLDIKNTSNGCFSLKINGTIDIDVTGCISIPNNEIPPETPSVESGEDFYLMLMGIPNVT